MDTKILLLAGGIPQAYRFASFRKYKQGTLHMVKSLVLDDVTPLNPNNQIKNFILEKLIV